MIEYFCKECSKKIYNVLGEQESLCIGTRGIVQCHLCYKTIDIESYIKSGHTNETYYNAFREGTVEKYFNAKND